MAVEGEVVQKNKGGRPVKFDDIDAFNEAIAEYFETCKNTRDLPTITGLAVHLDTNRETLRTYKDKDGFSDSIKRALAKCEAAIESRAMLGGLNPAMAIFSLKNNYGWVDKSEVDNKHEMVQPIVGGMAKAELDEGDEQDNGED